MLCRSLPVLLALASLPASPLTAPALAQEMEAIQIGSVFGRPTAIAFAPGVTHQFYVATKNGRIYIVRGGSVAGTLLDLTPDVYSQGESGLLGFIFDPDFATNRQFYVAYTQDTNQGDSMLSRFTMMPGSDDIADPASEQILWGPIVQTTGGHKAGDLEFGPDGMLYHSLGDGDASSSGGHDTAQVLSDPRGKILRFDVDLPYPHIPADNPFVGVPGVDERIWAYGFRNPFRIEVDSVTGDVYVGDVGTSRWEEVNRLPAGVGGINAGWPCMEGPECRSHPACSCPSGSITGPIFSLSQQPPHNACSIMMGVVYRGAAMPSQRGNLLFADFCTGRYYMMEDPAGAANVVEVTSQLNPVAGVFSFAVDFATDHEGEIYVAEHYSGDLWRIVPRCGFQVYCSSTANSSGRAASISALGSSSIASANMTLEVSDLPASSFGFFLVSQTQTFAPNLGGGQGNLCLGSPIFRWSNRIQTSSAAGQVSMFTDLTDLPSMVQVDAGLTWNFQYWTRDANPSATSNTSDGLSVTFCP
ncbi:MAG: PQQ-dependent sugar dehydrogenase [Planctomycetota bacterium]